MACRDRRGRQRRRDAARAKSPCGNQRNSIAVKIGNPKFHYLKGDLTMSFRIQPPAPARPNRCQLFGPASNAKLFEKMAASAADVINLDLEDSVAPSDKDIARKNAIEAINDIDWGKKTLSVRINGLDSPYWYKDVVDLVEQTNGRLDMIMIPKAGCGEDIYAVDALVSSIEAAKGSDKRIAFE